MFINKLIYFYKSDLSLYNLVLKHIPRQWKAFLLTIIISTVSIVVLLVKNQLLYLVIPVIVFIISMYLFNKSITKVIKSIHKIDIISVLRWKDWKEYKVKLLKIHLEQNNYLDEEDIRKFIVFTEKEATKSKPSFYYIVGIPGLVLALFVPVWNQFNFWIFTNEITTLELGISYIVIIFLGLLLIGFMLITLKLITSDILESNYRKLNELTYLLELVLVSINEPIIDNTIIERLN